MDIRDVGHIDHIGHVDPADIGVADPVRRPVHLARPQRDPADRGPHRHPDAQADEGHQRRRIDRPHHHADARLHRHPAPARPHLHPTPVMERREAPGRVIDPGPAPRRHPSPVAVAIRHPAHRHRREPDAAILGRRLPGAGVHQRVTAGHLRHQRRRRILAGRHRPFARQFGGGERREALRAKTALEHIRAGDRRGLLRPHLQRHAVAIDLGGTVQHGDAGGLPGIAGLHHIAAGRPDGHLATRRGDGGGLARQHVAQAQVQPALRHGDRERVVVERVDIQLRALVHHQPGGAHLKLRARPRLGPVRPAGGDRIIERRRLPLGLVGGVERHRAPQIRHPADGGGRIGRRQVVAAFGLRPRRAGQHRGEQQRAGNGGGGQAEPGRTGAHGANPLNAPQAVATPAHNPGT